MWNEDDRKWLYDTMSRNGVDTGSYEEFTESLNNKEDRDWYYNKSLSLGLNVGSAEDFDGMMIQPQEKAWWQTEVNAPKAESPYAVNPVEFQAQVDKEEAEVNKAVEDKLAQEGPKYLNAMSQQMPQGQTMQGAFSRFLEGDTYAKMGTPEYARAQMVQARHDYANMPAEAREKLLEQMGGKENLNAQFEQMNGRQPKDEMEVYEWMTGGYAVRPEYATEDTPANDIAKYNGYSANEINAGMGDEKAVALYTKDILSPQLKAAQEKTNAMLKERDAEIEAANREREEGMPWYVRAGVNMSKGGTAGMPSYVSSNNGRYTDQEWKMLSAAANINRETEQLIDAAVNDRKFFTGFGRTIANIDTWFPLMSGLEMSALMELKNVDPEKASPAQKALMEALALRASAEASYAGDISNWYRVGEGAANMIPLMGEMAFNPLSGVGKAAAKKVAKGTMKSQTKKALAESGKTAMKQWQRRVLAKGTGGFLGSLAGGAGMAATTSLPKVAVNAGLNSLGQAQYDINAGGIAFGGMEAGDGYWTEFGREFARTAIEHGTEQMGAEWLSKAIGKPLKWIGKGVSKIPGVGKGVTRTAQFLDNTFNPKKIALLKNLAKDVKYDGPLDELGEEFMSALLTRPIDDDSLQKFFEKDNLLVTLGTVTMPFVAGTTVAGGYNLSKGNYKAGAREKQQQLAANARAAWSFGENQEEWRNIMYNLNNPDTFVEEMQRIYNSPDYTEEQKKNALEYAVHTLRYMAATGSQIDLDENTQMLNGMLRESYGWAYDNTNPAAVNGNMVVAADKALRDAEAEVRRSLVLSEDADVDAFINGRSIDELAMGDDAVAEALRRYYAEKALFEGMQDKMQDTRENEYLEADKSVDAVAHKVDGVYSGNIYRTTLTKTGEEIFITGGKVVLDNEGYIDVNQSEGLVALINGEHKAIKVGDVRDKVAVENAEAQKAAKRAEIDARYKQQLNTFTYTDKADGAQHTIQLVSRGEDMARVVLDGVEQDIPNNVFDEIVAEATAEASGKLKGESGEQEAENAESGDVVSPVETTQPVVEQTALERVPKAENGEPVYEQADAETAWDAIMEQTNDEEMATQVVEGMIADKEAALKKLENAKVREGNTVAEKIAAAQQRKAAIEQAKADLAKWQEIAGVKAKRAETAAVESVETVPVVEQVAPVESAPVAEETQPTAEVAEETPVVEASQAANEVQPVQMKNGKPNVNTYSVIKSEFEKKALRERAAKWAKKLGVKVHVLESYDEVTDEQAKVAILEHRVPGWFAGGEVYIYMPHVKNGVDLDKTVVHEVVAHKGIKQLLGKEFNKFLDHVWEMMSVPARAKFLSYVGAGKNATQADRRAAADEYVAALAEKVYKKQGMTAEEKTIWQKIADWFRQAFNVDEAKAEVLSKETLTDEDIAKMVRASYETLQSNKVDNEVASVDGGRAMFSKKEWGEIEEANKNFNEELDAFKEKKHNTLLHLGTPKRILSAAGVNAKELTLSPKVLNRKMEQHDLTTDDLKDLAMAIQSPILVYKHGENVPNIVVVTELNVKGGKLSIAIKLDENGNVVEINNVSSVHSKDAQTEIERLAKMGDEGLKDGLKWVEKEKVLDWFGIADLNSPIHTNNPELISIANIINNFENPSIESEKSSAEEENKTYFRKANENQEIFVSNARKAVGEIKQEKATPQQWLAMIKKNGGLKAGEDKWMGLSEWLENNESKSLTKQEVLDFVNENAIKIEEVEYEANPNSFEALKEEYEDLVRNEGFDAAQDVMLERFGDIFSIAFDDLGGELVIANKDAAATLLGSGNIINSTRLDYTTEGLENKREIALVVPTVEPYNQHDEIHFGDAGEGRAVAWVRFGETTDSEGNRVLVIDEIQSKRHQDGREKGYKSQADRTPATMDELSFGEYNGMTTVSLRGERFFFKSSTSKNEILDIINERIAAGQLGSANGLVPDAPFEKNWQELAMKRMLRLAAEEGFDKVAWTTGEQQAERYNMSHAVEGIDVAPYKAPDSESVEWLDVQINAGPSSIDLRVETDGNIVSGGNGAMNLSGEKLSNVVGKELAEKILSSKDDITLQGDGLRIGGEGMKGFYDKMLPSFVSKYTKKWGAKVGTVEMPNLEQNNVMHSVDVTPEMKKSVMEGQTMFRKDSMREHAAEWADGMQKQEPKQWAKIVEAMKLSPVWNMVEGDDNSRAAEVLQRLSDGRINDIAKKELEQAQGIVAKAEVASKWNRIKSAIKDFWNWVQRNIFNTEPKNWEDFVDEVVGDFEGKTKVQRLKQRVGGLTRDILNAVFEKAGIDINLAEPAEVEQVAVSLSSVGEPTAPLGQRSSAESGERKGESQAVEGENQVESGSLSSVDESTAPLQARNRNMDREAFKKAFKKGGEKAYDLMYELHGGIVSAYPQEFLAYLKEVIGVADDVANIIEGAHDYLIADFKKKNPDLFKKNETEKVEDVHSLLATKGYSLLEHTMDNGKAIGMKMMYRDKFVPSGKTDASYTPDTELHGRTVICYYNHPEARLQNQYVFTVTKNNAMETPTAYELVADPSLMTPEWAEYLEKIGRKDEDGTFFLDGLVPNFNDPFSLSHLMIRVNKNSHDIETISRYNHGAFNERGEYERIAGQPNATLGNDLDKLVDGLNESLMEYKQLESLGAVPLGENMIVANDGKIYRYNDIKGGVHVGDGFWVDRRGDAHVINPGKEKLVGEFLYGGGKVKNVANGESVDIHGLKFTENGVEFYTGGEEVAETREIEIKGEKKTVTKKVIKGDAKNVITFDGDKTRLETESADSETIGRVGKLYDVYSIKGDNLKEAKSGFLEDFFWVRRIDFPNLEKAGDNCFNATLTSANLPKLREVGVNCFNRVRGVDVPSLPSLEKVGANFLYSVGTMGEDVNIDFPKLREVGNFFMKNAQPSVVSLPSLETVGEGFMKGSMRGVTVDLPNLTKVGYEFFGGGFSVQSLNAPKLTDIKGDFMEGNPEIRQQIMEQTGKEFVAIENIEEIEVEDSAHELKDGTVVDAKRVIVEYPEGATTMMVDTNGNVLAGVFAGKKLADVVGKKYAAEILKPGNFTIKAKEETRFRFIGTQGAENLDKAEEATTRLDNLNVAREMETAGKDAKAIKLATGWERGADGKWRYETEDAKVNRGAKLFNLETRESYPIAGSIEIGRVDDNSTIRLTDLVKDEELFKAYPEMEEYYVSFEKMPAETKGSHNFKEKMIRINKDDIHSLGSTLVHEIQHAVQSIEGFALGSSPEYFEELDRPKAAYHDMYIVRSEAERLVEKGEYKNMRNAVKKVFKEYLEKGWFENKTVEYFELNNPEEDWGIKNFIDEALYFTAEELNDFSINNPDPKDLYKRTAGEVESRNVQERMGYTEEQRRNELATETEDVSRKDQIFIFDNLGVSGMMGSRVDARMAEVASHFDGKELSAEQRSVVDVFGGKADNLTISVKTQDGNERNVEMRQGNDLAGAKHSLYAHYGTTKGVINADDLLLIPDVIANGERTENGKKAVYKLDVNGTKYTVVTYVKQNKEEFHNFYSNKKGQPSQSVNASIGDTQSARITEELASDDKGSDNSLNEQEERTLFRKAVQDSEEARQEIESLDNEVLATIEELAQELYSNVGVIADIESIPDEKKRRDAKRGMKGWYDPATGMVSVVLPNIADKQDAVETMLHEIVGHRGLRGLLGEKYNEFLNEVFVNAPKEMRADIMKIVMAQKADGSRTPLRTAVEEYLAGIAEGGFVNNPTLWTKIMTALKQLLRSMGVKVDVSENELAYMLWRSHQLLKGGYNIEQRIIDSVMQQRMEVGEYRRRNTAFHGPMRSQGRNLAKEIELFGLRDEYEKMVLSSGFQSREAFQDSMLALKKFQEMLEKATGKKLPDYFNAYYMENALSSANQAQAEAYGRLFYKKIVDEINKLKKTFKQEDIFDYLIIKHGIERNREMAVRSVLSSEENGLDRKMYKKYVEKKKDILKKAEENKLSWEETQRELDDLAERFGADLSKDYSGLSAIFSKVKGKEVMRAAYNHVLNMDKSGNFTNLHKAIKAATDETLEKRYSTGMLSKKTKEEILDMYEYYVPLRGFEEQTSEDVYHYMTTKSSPISSVKAARGRTSKSDNAIAWIANAAEEAIVRGNRNMMKMAFFNAVAANPNDLVSIEGDTYLELKNGQWTVAFPDIPVNATPEQVREIWDDFIKEKEQQAKANPDMVKKVSDNADIPYTVVQKGELQEHQIFVRRNGRLYTMTVNGNPRLAQAINGVTNPNTTDSKLMNRIADTVQSINSGLSRAYTTANPDFVLSNWLRDMIYSNSMVWVKESPAYAWKFNRNCGLNARGVFKLISKYENGTLDMKNDVERMFHEFIINGGETGYTQLKDYEASKKDLQKMLKKGIPGEATAAAVQHFAAQINRAVENAARFAAYRTSREMGRSIIQSVHDAKEISVNFNKKGAGARFFGAKGQTKTGSAVAAVSGIGRAGYVFWNAGVQGMYNFFSAWYDHKLKGTAMIFTPLLLGYLAASMGDDDDDYQNLSPYIRRSNLCFKLTDGTFLTIPLPIEYRTFYGITEYLTNVGNGNEEFNKWELAGQLSQLLPLDMLEGGGGFKAFVPSLLKPIYEVAVNKDWTGRPIAKQTDFNKLDPEYKRVYGDVSAATMAFSKMMNELGGGNPNRRADATIEIGDETYEPFEWNPAYIENTLRGYLGGMFSFPEKVVKTAGMIAGKREFDWRHVPLANRILKTSTEKAEEYKVNGDFFDNLGRFEKDWHEMRGWKKDAFDFKGTEDERESALTRYGELLDKNGKLRELYIIKSRIDKSNSLYKEFGEEAFKQQMLKYRMEFNKKFNEIYE